MPATLAKRLADWDQKDIQAVKDIYEDHSSDPDFLTSLAEQSSKSDQQVAATWLIKHHLERTRSQLSAKFSSLLLSSLPHLTAWAAQLHVLQILEKVAFSETDRDKLIAFVDRCGQSDNKMVRAWAYYGLAVIADRFPDLKQRAVERLQQATTVETAGSIKVRLRKGLKLLTG